MILKGKLYGADEALKLGLVDEVAPREQLLEAARKKLRRRKTKSYRRRQRAIRKFAAPREHNAAPARASK